MVSETTKLTKKAILYYSDQKLVSPRILENGYRYFTSEECCY
ncbi:MerR family transcriptional regulator [Enterococcus sp. OL5]